MNTARCGRAGWFIGALVFGFLALILSAAGTRSARAVGITPATITVTASANPAVYGQSVTLTATVAPSTPGGPTPSGNVTFFNGTTGLATKKLVGGVVSYTTTYSVGTKSISGTYTGDATYAISSSSPFNLVINPTPTTTTVTSSANPANLGSPITLTATVAASLPGTGAPSSGSLKFYDGATLLASRTPAAGVATLAVTPTIGTHTMTAVFAGSASYLGSTSSPLSEVVNPALSTTTLSSSSNSTIFGTSVTFTATVASATGSPLGTVTFTDGPTTLGVASVSNGSATFSTAGLAVGTHSVGASFAGNSVTQPSGTSIGHTVAPAPTTTTVVASSPTTFVGDSVTFTATVVSATGTPTGTVTFTDGAITVGVAPLAAGQAVLTTATLPAGAHSLTANYAGDDTSAASSSSPVAHTVTAGTATVLAANVSPSAFGAAVTFTATVSSVSGTPTGSVTFAEGPTSISTETLVDGQASLTTAALPTGDHALTATYAGDGAFSPSTSPTLTHSVDRASTALALSASPTASAFGDPVVFTATVTPVNPGPTGSVVLFDGTTAIGTAAIQNGTAEFTVSTLGLGPHSITASLAGDSNFLPSTSAAVAFIVASNPTTTTMTASPNPAPYGTPVIFSANVTGVGGAPSGTVTFASGPTVFGTVDLVDGQATLTASGLEPGTFNVTATYAGDASFAQSASPGLGVTIDRAASTTDLTVTPNPAIATDPVALTATVTSNAGTPTGTVTFRDGPTELGTSALVDGQASLAVNFATAGAHTISAGYDGNSRYLPSVSAAVGQTITLAPSATALVGSPTLAAIGQPVTLTASVTSALGVPTGTVTFTDGSTSLGTNALVAGQASLTTTALEFGPHSIIATYSGSPTFASSTSPAVTETIATGLLFVDQANPACKTTGTGAGSAATPYCTINGAAGKVVPGVTVQVAAGTYAEKVTIGASGTAVAPITLTPAPGATVTVFGGANGFVATNKSWIVIRGFTVDGTKNPGIVITGGTNVTIDGNRVTHSGLPVSGSIAVGIKLSGTTNSLVANNITDHNTDAGILVTTDANNNVITRNESFANARGYSRAAAGIDLRNSTGNTVTANVVHDNEDSGINLWTGSTQGSNLAANNVSYANGDHGIDVHNAMDARVIANTVYNNYDSGIEMTTSTGTVLANNISVDNGIGSLRTSGNIRADSASAPTSTVNDDLVFLRVPGTVIDWGGVKYGSLATFRAATGQESRGIEANPQFVNPLAASFRLLSGSPAIDSANTAAPGQPLLDADGLGRYDDAAPNTGAGTITYADRGAFEYRP